MAKDTIKARLDAWLARRQAAKWICSEFVGRPGIVKADENKELRAKVRELRERLREIEWAGSSEGYRTCPACKAEFPEHIDDAGSIFDHGAHERCWLKREIDQLDAEERGDTVSIFTERLGSTLIVIELYNVSIPCPSCGSIMARDGEEAIYCRIPSCDFHHRRFKAPTIELVPFEESEPEEETGGH